MLAKCRLLVGKLISLRKLTARGTEAYDRDNTASPTGNSATPADVAPSVRFAYRGSYESRALDIVHLGKWLARGCPPALPDILKRRVVAGYARRFHLDTFVESGTYLGATVEYLLHHCPTIYSVEYQERLWKRACERFRGRAGVHILHGSGADLMPLILSKIRKPALFWLDGHFGPGKARQDEVACPTMEELTAVLRHRGDHVILIDDAKSFRGERGYPTVDYVVSTAHSLRPEMNIQVSRDIIRVTPAGQD